MENKILGADAAAVESAGSSALDAAPHVAHTPGPWFIKRAEVRVDGEFDYAIYDANKQVIAEAFGRTSPTNFPPAEANAHLIAAAPELLELARKVADHFSDTDAPLGAAAVAAIAKAEGRS